MKKILIIVADSKYFLSHRLSLSVYLQSHGFEVFVATDILSGNDRNKIEGEGIKLYELPSRPSSVGFSYSIRLINCLVKLSKSINPDVILSVSMRVSFLSMIASFFSPRAKVRHYSLITGMGFLATSKSIVYKTIRIFAMGAIKLISLSDKFYIIVQNHDDYREFASVLDQKRLFCVLGSGVDTEKHFPTDRKSDGKVVVTMVSRMLKDKGVAELVEAARIIKLTSAVDIKIQLVGDSYQFNPRSYTHNQLTRWHQDGYVCWLGTRHDISAIYQESDIAVLPSYREGLPKSLLEAAACGLPLITTDTPGCREICKHGVNGFLVPVKNSKLLANAILELASSEAMRKYMGKNSRKLVESTFSLEIINDAMLDLLEGREKNVHDRLLHEEKVPDHAN